MRDFYYLNVAGTGYTSACVEGDSVRVGRAADDADAGNYREVFHHFAETLSSDTGTYPFFCVSRRRPESPVAVAYGLTSDSCDEFGRSGLVFLHSVETTDESLLALFVRLVTMLNGPFLRRLDDGIARTAGSAEPTAEVVKDFLLRTTAEIRGPRDRTDTTWQHADLPTVRTDLLRSVICDIDASVAAWLLMIARHAGADGSWQLSESVHRGVRRVSSDHPLADGESRLSELLLGDRWRGTSTSERRDRTRNIVIGGVLAVTMVVAVAFAAGDAVGRSTVPAPTTPIAPPSGSSPAPVSPAPVPPPSDSFPAPVSPAPTSPAPTSPAPGPSPAPVSPAPGSPLPGSPLPDSAPPSGPPPPSSPPSAP